MIHVLRLWWPLLGAIALIQIGNGLTGSLISVTSEVRGFAPWLAGLILSAFYAGSLAGALIAPGVIHRATHGASFAGFTVLFTAATAAFALSQEPGAWAALRFLAGVGISGMFATAESRLNLATADRWRGRVFAVYVMVQLVGLASGQFLLNARMWGEAALFLIAAGVAALAFVFMRFEAVESPHPETPRRIGLAALAARAPLGVAAVTLAGFAWAGLMASAPALVERIGLDDLSKSIFMAGAIVAGLLAQFPVGFAADHADRRIVLAGLSACAAAAACVGLLGHGFAVLMLFAVAFGALTFPLYAVGVAQTNDVLSGNERTAASAAMIVFFQAGAIAAPPIIAYAMAALGPAGYFLVQAAAQLAFAAAAGLALRR